jgi:hypothetical protein
VAQVFDVVCQSLVTCLFSVFDGVVKLQVLIKRDKKLVMLENLNVKNYTSRILTYNKDLEESIKLLLG